MISPADSADAQGAPLPDSLEELLAQALSSLGDRPHRVALVLEDVELASVATPSWVEDHRLADGHGQPDGRPPRLMVAVATTPLRLVVEGGCSSADARWVARTVGLWLRMEHERLEAHQLAAALESTAVVERARGVLMERAGVSADVAMAQLRDLASRRGLPVVEIAQQVLARPVDRVVGGSV